MSSISIKQILRKKFLNIKKEHLLTSKESANAYHFGLRQNLQALISALLQQGAIKPKDNNPELFIGTYLPIAQREIVPPCLSEKFQLKFQLKARYFTPSFTIQDRSMHFVQYRQSVNKNQQFKLGAFGVKVPIIQTEKYKIDPPNMDILLVPLICIQQKSLQRIGYGGGYYDNYIKKNKPQNTVSVGVALQNLVFNQDFVNFEQEKQSKSERNLWQQCDQPLDFAITQTCVIKRK